MVKITFSPPLKPFITREVLYKKDYCPRCTSTDVVYTEDAKLLYGKYAFLDASRQCVDCSFEWEVPSYESGDDDILPED